jgi:hypothetical protein
MLFTVSFQPHTQHSTPNTQGDDPPLSAVRDRVFSIFAATFQFWRQFIFFYYLMMLLQILSPHSLDVLIITTKVLAVVTG